MNEQNIPFLSDEHKWAYESWFDFQHCFANVSEDEYWQKLEENFGGAGMDIWYIAQRSRFDPNMVYELLTAKSEGRYYPVRLMTGEYEWNSETGHFGPSKHY